MGFSQPSIILSNNCIYSESDIQNEYYKENLALFLCQIPHDGIVDRTTIIVKDRTKDLKVSDYTKLLVSF